MITTNVSLTTPLNTDTHRLLVTLAGERGISTDAIERAERVAVQSAQAQAGSFAAFDRRAIDEWERAANDLRGALVDAGALVTDSAGDFAAVSQILRGNR